MSAAQMRLPGMNPPQQLRPSAERSAPAFWVRRRRLGARAAIASIEGHGAFPRFLVHDGAREADMAPDVYERIFLLAQEIEKCFEGGPAFQYIVTTTTTPPEKFIERNAPWLRLQLSGLPAQERLLRRDL